MPSSAALAFSSLVPEARSWLERLWSSIADRGEAYAKVPQASASASPVDRTRQLAEALLSGRGEASGAAVARELHACLRGLSPADRLEFYGFLATSFGPEPGALRAAAEAYLADPTSEHAARLAEAAEPPRQELLRRMNTAPRGTAALVAMRKELLAHLRGRPELRPLDADLKHLLSSWFNRGFLELRRIDWQTPAVVLEKLIAYEAVHEIHGWDDLRRRLAADRRCFGFFHPALPDEPLIFVEVALTRGLASAVQPLLCCKSAEDEMVRSHAETADTAIFYSISNCQEGLRNISFGNFLIKQVVEELKAEVPQVVHYSTLSPVPGFRPWMERRLRAAQGPERRESVVPEEEATSLQAVAGRLSGTVADAFQAILGTEAWWLDDTRAETVRGPLMRLCAEYLTRPNRGMGAIDPVARFHLGNGARLERINWLGNTSPRGLAESCGMMVNYLYDPEMIEANHEAFARNGTVARSREVDALLTTAPDLRIAGR